MTTSLLLDQTLWDLVVDAQGNIAVAKEPYAAAQDVACAIKLFQGELWYDSTQGVPYFQSILGRQPPISLIKAQYVAAALAVPGVVSAACYITSLANREVQGQVQVTLADGTVIAVGIGSANRTILTGFAITDDGTPGVTDDGIEVVVG